MNDRSSQAAASKPFTISRTVNAPREVVWKAYTERERLMQWFGPKGFVTSHATLDLRQGGIYHYCLRSPDGHEMWGKWIFREIVGPEKLVVLVAFSDAHGGITRHPMSPTWPLQTLSTTTLAEQGDKTVITVEWSAYDATEEEQKAFDAGHESMTMGFTGTFDQLDAYLASL